MKSFKPNSVSMSTSSPEKKKYNRSNASGGNFMQKNAKPNAFFGQKNNQNNALNPGKPRVLSISQLLARLRLQRQKRQDQQKRGLGIQNIKRSLKPIIPPKSLVIILKEKPEKAIYNRRIIDYKHCGLLQRYIGLGGKILPRRQTRLTAKQQRYVAKAIKSARVMALLPFVSKQKGFFP